MTKYIFAASAAAVLLLSATPAAAQEAPSGPRVEAQLGYDSYNGGFVEGFYNGFGAGYDFSLGGASLGADIEIGRSTGEKRLFHSYPEGDVTTNTEIDGELYVGGRISIPVLDSLALYAKGGYVHRRVSLEVFADSGLAVGSGSFEEEKGGYRVGGGGRFSIGGGTYLGSEYRFSDFGGGSDDHQFIATVGYQF